MSKTQHFKSVILTADWANKKKGDVILLDSMIASTIVRHLRVGEYTDLPVTESKAPAAAKAKAPAAAKAKAPAVDENLFK